jgi:hypothetical protein
MLPTMSAMTKLPGTNDIGRTMLFRNLRIPRRRHIIIWVGTEMRYAESERLQCGRYCQQYKK